MEQVCVINDLTPSEYVTLVVTVPETHATLIREVMGQAGAGESEHYSHASFSVKRLVKRLVNPLTIYNHLFP